MSLRHFSVTIVLLLCAVSVVHADEKANAVSDESVVLFKSAPTAPATRTLFVVETDEQSAVESLNRVSGEIDKGFIYSSDDASYKSKNQTKPSPFARQEQQDHAK